MNYYKKYLKYKNKYLYLKGGKPVEPEPVEQVEFEPEPFTGIELPVNLLDYQNHITPILNPQLVVDVFTTLNRPRNINQTDESYYEFIQSPLKEKLIENNIQLVNLRNYLQANLEQGCYINIADWHRREASIFARNRGGIMEFYMFVDGEYQRPRNSRLALFLRGYTPSDFFAQARAHAPDQG